MKQAAKNFLKEHQRLFNIVFFVMHFGEEMRSFFRPSSIPQSPGNPFHGDEIWKSLVKKMLDMIPVTSVVETGTFRGDTTMYLAALYTKAIYTCEVVGMYYRGSKQRLAKHSHVVPLHGSSQKLLGDLIHGEKLGGTPFFFLDAHWYGYWPLKDEMELVRTLPRAIIMVDDFKVPGRPYFGYDVQEKNGVVTEADINYLAPMLLQGKSRVLFPRYGTPTSSLRGHIVIFQNMPSEFDAFYADSFVREHYEEYRLNVS